VVSYNHLHFSSFLSLIFQFSIRLLRSDIPQCTSTSQINYRFSRTQGISEEGICNYRKILCLWDEATLYAVVCPERVLMSNTQSYPSRQLSLARTTMFGWDLFNYMFGSLSLLAIDGSVRTFLVLSNLGQWECSNFLLQWTGETSAKVFSPLELVLSKAYKGKKNMLL
jgi:hypothetical protein